MSVNMRTNLYKKAKRKESEVKHMSKRYLIFYLVILLMVSLFIAGCAGSTDNTGQSVDQEQTKPTYVLKASIHTTEDNYEGVFVKKWADLIEERTGGRIKVKFYWSYSSGPPQDQLSMLESGVMDVLDGLTPLYPGKFTVSNVVGLPFVTKNPREAGKILNELYERGYMKEFDSHKLLFFLPTDMMYYFFKDKQVNTLEELAGMKMRAPSGVPVDTLAAMGASPVAMPNQDLYMAIERGIVKGAYSAPSFMAPNRFYEVVDYALDMPISTGIKWMGMNLETWNKLPDDLKAIIEEINKEAYQMFLDINDKAEADGKKTLKENGVTFYTLSDAEKERWEKSAIPVIEQYIKVLDSKGYNGSEIMEIVEKNKS